MNIAGASSEDFYVNVKLEPKDAYDYYGKEFTDIYSKANVLYSELIQYDANVISFIRDTDIPYDDVTVYKFEPVDPLNPDPSSPADWVLYTPDDNDKAIIQTYGHLFDAEYVDDSDPFVPYSNCGDDFIRCHLKKKVDIDITKSVETYTVSVVSEFVYPYTVADPTMQYQIVVQLPTLDGLSVEYYKFIGQIDVVSDPIEESFPLSNPIYILYAKEDTAITTDPITGAIVAPPRLFRDSGYNINIVDVYLNNGTDTLPVNLYLVEQDGHIDDVNYHMNLYVKAETLGAISPVYVYTNEDVDLTNVNIGCLKIPRDDSSGGCQIFSEKDPINTKNMVAYTVKDDSITAVYKVTVDIYYDENRDGVFSSDEIVYTAVTED